MVLPQRLWLLSLLGLLGLVTAETPEEFCSKQGAGFVPQYETDGTFAGNCKKDDSGICLGTEYPHPKTKAMVCCDDGTALKTDTSVNEAGCCAGNKIFKWNGGPGSCVDPPPPVPSLSCPSSHMTTINRKGVTFKIWCQHYVKEWVPPWTAISSLATLSSGRIAQGNFDLESCIDACVADKNCNGANFWVTAKNCGLQNKGKQGSIFAAGDWYLSTPWRSLLGPPVIAIVAVPRRV